MRAFALRLFLCLGALFVLTGGARAEFTACNDAAEPIRVALGFWDNDRGWMSEGWFQVAAGACRVVDPDPLTNRYVYVYATNLIETLSWFSTEEEGGSPFCVAAEDFLLVMESFIVNNRTNCGGDDYDELWFTEIDKGDTTAHTHHFAVAEARPE